MAISVGSDLIEQQIKRWELARQRAPEVVRPCVALSRLPGTPAVELGQRVAERLGYGFFGIELVDEIARTQGVSRYIVEQLDERVRTGLDRWLLDTFRGSSWTEKEYLHNVGRVVSALAEKGAAVIVGRGATFLLRAEQAFSVQVIASRESREHRLAEARGIDAKEARASLADEERERLRFLREFAEDPNDPLHFDLVVNTDRRTVEDWADLIADAVERLSRGDPSP